MDTKNNVHNFLVFAVKLQGPQLRTGIWLPVTDEPTEFEKWLVQVQDFRQIAHHFGGSYSICFTIMKINRKIPTCNWLDLETCKFDQFCPKSPGHSSPCHLFGPPTQELLDSPLTYFWVLICTYCYAFSLSQIFNNNKIVNQARGMSLFR